MKLLYLKGIFEIFLIKVYLEINKVLETLKTDDQKYDCIQQGPYSIHVQLQKKFSLFKAK